MKNKIVNIHDKFLKSILADIDLAKDFFKTFLPKETQDVIDIESLKSEKGSFVDSNLQETLSDAIFKFSLTRIM